MNSKIFSTILFLLLIAKLLVAQTVYPAGYFIMPMSLPLNLAGSFGEIRSEHFHSGIDIKTNEQEGQVVMAAADGYVSRIKVSPFGFGKAIYINHPNGYTTVYAHLQRFNENINAYVNSLQYTNQSFDIDVMPDSNLFPVRRGQLIAFSGNTGGSEGPHLHFEIRDKITEQPINPLLFGFQPYDTIPPVINAIKLYELHNSEYGFITDTTLTIAVVDSSVNTHIKTDTIFVFENTAFAVETFDKTVTSQSMLDVDKIELLLDKKTIYYYHLTHFGFDETKYANAAIDFAEKITNKTIYTLLYRLPANNFSAFSSDTSMKGIVVIADDKVHEIEIRATDFNQNVTMKELYLMRKKNSHFTQYNAQLKKIISEGNFISYKKAPVIKQTDLKISFPAMPAVYNVYPFIVKREKKLKGTFSPLFSIGEKTIPVHTFILLSVKPVQLTEKYFSKALLVSVDEHGNKTAEESSFTNGWVTGKIKHFGKFTMAVDTVKPEIKVPVLFTDSITLKQKLIVEIADDLCGIKSYRATMDGKWVLMEYDAKAGTLSYDIKTEDVGRKVELSIEVQDRKDNIAELKTNWEF